MPAYQPAVEPHAHGLQFYGADEGSLIANVSKYLSEGIRKGEGVLVFASPEHTAAFSRQLQMSGIDLRSVIDKRQLVLLDARETLAQFMAGGEPDQERFESTIRDLTNQVSSRSGLRAYGEMVGVLWESGRFSAALRLEELWNGVLGSLGLQLFCGYPIDIFAADFQRPAVGALLRAHTHLLPTGQDGDVQRSLNRAFFDVVGSDLRPPIESRAEQVAVPKAEATILALRTIAPKQADRVLARARRNYESEKRFRALIENSSDGIALMGRSGEVQYASASASKVLGHDAAALVGTNSLDLIHPADVADARQTIAKALETPRCPARFESRVRRGDGQLSWVESTLTNLLDEPGVEAIVWNYRDITERKTTEEALRASERRLAERERYLATLLDSLPECVMLLGRDGEVLQMNPAGLEIVEAAGPEDMLGNSIYPLIDEAGRQEFRALNEAVFHGGAGGTIEFSITGLKGTRRRFETHVVPLRDASENIIGALSATSDITQRKRAEAALLYANEGLEQFAYAAAHDLQEPIRNVVLYTQLLARQYGPGMGAEANQLMSVTVDGARRMQTLVQDLLAFTRSLERPKDEITSTDANEVMEEVISNLRTAIEIAGAEVMCERLQSLPASRAHLVQLFQNLIANALKYRGAQPPAIRISVKEHPDHFLVSVKDNGMGIAPEHCERVFGVFKRLHGRDIPGNGIGLAICSRIVASYQGRIWVESEPGKGSEFLFTLPRNRRC